jgi:hypothetical protein
VLRSSVSASGLALLVCAIGCAPIDVSNAVTVEPTSGPIVEIGNAQLVARDFVAEYVQVGPRLSVEISELSTCVRTRHHPVLRIEHVRRTTRGMVVWDFVLGAATGGFAALAFARPQTFSTRLVDGTGRQLYDYSGAYIVGGVFSAISVGLLSAGIVDAIRSRDTTRYADAYEVERGPEQPCGEAESVPLNDRPVTLRIQDATLGDDPIELDGITDETGRVRFELPAWPGDVPLDGSAVAVLRVSSLGGGVEQRVLVFSLRVPYSDVLDAQAGVADTRLPPATRPLDLDLEAVELPEPLP